MLFSNDPDQLAYACGKAAVFMHEHDMAELPNGRYDLCGGDYVNIMEYTTKERAEACYESHVEYVDIQMVLRGAEYLEIVPVEGLTVTSPYSEKGDCALYDGAPAGERFLMLPGRFCMVGPNDAHMPSVATEDGPAPAKKAVFKIRVDHLPSTKVV